jgi:hypothetical protein
VIHHVSSVPILYEAADDHYDVLGLVQRCKGSMRNPIVKQCLMEIHGAAKIVAGIMCIMTF